jgi:CRISPR-associated protein Cmr4
MKYLTYTYLLSPLHTGASSQAGNLMGIAREVHTELPYLPSSSIRGKIRSMILASEKSDLASEKPDETGILFGEKIKDGSQPTEGEVWFGDASLLLFPIASYSHQFLWITCPLWLGRWSRWREDKDNKLSELVKKWRALLNNADEAQSKKAISSIKGQSIYLQGALLEQNEIAEIDKEIWEYFKDIPDNDGILDLKNKLLVLSDDDCGAMVEIGLQREVRITLKDDEKTVSGGSFRAEEAIPSETVLFFPWGLKPDKDQNRTANAREMLWNTLNQRIQFGGLEGLGRGWTENKTIEIKHI